MKILLEYFNAKLGSGSIFKTTILNEGLLQDINENGARVVNFAKSKNLNLESTMFPHRNIYQHT